MNQDNSAVSFDASGFLPGSGACFSFDPIPIFFNGQGQDVVLDQDAWCTVAQLLRALVLMVAYFKAAQILMRG